MAKKGIDVYAYAAVPGYQAVWDVPRTEKTTKGQILYTGQLEVSSILPRDEPFTFKVVGSTGNVIATRTNRINTWKGSLEEGSNMTDLSQMQSVITGDVVVAFGFWSAGSGADTLVGLPKFDRNWISITQERSTWMGMVAPVHSSQAAQPFNTFVLPSAHDAGMNSTTNIMTLLSNSNNAADFMTWLVGSIPVVGSLLKDIGVDALKDNAQDIITALAITQKDTLTTMLRTGARYFEFRPAYISTHFKDIVLPKKLYFMHWAIPGQAFDSWLAEAVQFLSSNPTEIVVVQIRSDGVDSSCPFASDADIDSYVSTALQGFNIVRGGFGDMSSPIDALRAANKRLIVLTHAQQYSTYSDCNSTLDGNDIVDKFPGFLNDASTGEKDKQIAVWQCQATSTNIKEVAGYCAAFAGGATSSLLCTKPACDAVTLPWLTANVYPKMPTNVLQAIMNDFFDGWTSDVAIELSRKYLQKAVSENKK